MAITGHRDTMHAGVTRTYRITVRGRDITNDSFKFSFGTEDTSYVSKDSTDELEINKTDPTNGVLEVYLQDTDTLTLPPTEYLWQCELTESGGAKGIVAEGKTKVLPNMPD